MIALSLKNRIEELGRLEAWLRQFSELHGVEERDFLTLNLVLEELFANVVRHGHDDGREHEVEFRLSVVDGDVHIEAEDDGREFNPLEAPPPDFDVPIQDRQPGGLGIHLVRSFVDRMDHVRSNGKNILRLVKKDVVAHEEA